MGRRKAQVHLGLIIKSAREKLGISQADLSRLMEVSRAAVSGWERGATGVDTDHLKPLARVLDQRIIGIDLDNCRNPKNKRISKWAVKIIKRFASYTETSPSGNGIRIFLRGKLPPGHRCKRGKIEVYSSDKFLTVTGRKIASHGAGSAIEDRTDELLAWHSEVFGDSTSVAQPSSTLRRSSTRPCAR